MIIILYFIFYIFFNIYIYIYNTMGNNYILYFIILVIVIILFTMYMSNENEQVADIMKNSPIEYDPIPSQQYSNIR